MGRWGPNGPAEVMPALSHGWLKGWRGPKPLTADFHDRGRGFDVLSVHPRDIKTRKVGPLGRPFHPPAGVKPCSTAARLSPTP